MITPGNKLEVFELFRIDANLPKYQKPKKAVDPYEQESKFADFSSEESSDNSFPRITNSIMFPAGTVTSWSANTGITMVQAGSIPYVPPSPTLLQKLAFWKRPKPLVMPKPIEPTMTIPDFFKSVKNTQREIEVVEARAKGYERALNDAKKAGQQALYEQLAAGLNATRMEAQLVAIGIKKFLSEEDVVRFYKECKKGLRLDWIANFARPIPQELLRLKERADELGTFDNYAVLHYDPEAKSYAETEAEKEAKKDPILFGLMKGRRVLYVVGDWIDEHCDLTLDQLAEHLGQDAIGDLEKGPHPYR